MNRRESLLDVVAVNRSRSTEKLRGRAATGGPEPPFKIVGHPAPTGLGRFLDVKAEHLYRDARPSYAPTEVLAHGI